jgi:hypothetical protein
VQYIEEGISEPQTRMAQSKNNERKDTSGGYVVRPLLFTLPYLDEDE